MATFDLKTFFRSRDFLLSLFLAGNGFIFIGVLQNLGLFFQAWRDEFQGMIIFTGEIFFSFLVFVLFQRNTVFFYSLRGNMWGEKIHFNSSKMLEISIYSSIHLENIR